MKVFPAPDLRCEAADSAANPCVSAGGSGEAVIESALPQKKSETGERRTGCQELFLRPEMPER